MANISGDSTDPWCTPTRYQNSSDVPDPTRTFVLEPTYKLITACTNTSVNPFFLKAYSITFHGTPSDAFSKSTSPAFALFLEIPLAFS